MKVISLANEEQVFVKKETTEGSLVYPSASDLVLCAGPAEVAQEVEFLEDEQIRGGRSRLSYIKGRVNPGSWSLTTYVKPSGTKGTAPEADVLFECLLGQKQVNSGVSVVYSLISTSNLPSFSLWVKKGHTVFACEGATVNSAEFTISGGEIAQIAWSGQFMRRYRAGTAKLTSEVNNGDDTCVVDNPERFSDSKIKIKIGNDDNGGEGYTITGINYSTKTISFSPTLQGAGESAGATVEPWWPTSGTETGSPVHGKLGLCTIEGVNTSVMSATISITNNIKYYEDEKNGQLYPTVYEAIGFREITGTLTLLFYKGAAEYFYRADAQSQNALIVPAGQVAGSIMEISCPQIEYRTPTLSGDEEFMIELPFIAVGTSLGDDEITVTFK